MLTRLSIYAESSAAAARLALASIAFAAGALLYDLARPATTTAYWSLFAPSFIHVVAMVLLIAAIQPPRRGGVALCSGWVAVSAGFELCQHPQLAQPLATALENTCGRRFVCQRTANYFLHGTFDTLDLVAAAMGGILAWQLLRITSRGEARS